MVEIHGITETTGIYGITGTTITTTIIITRTNPRW